MEEGPERDALPAPLDALWGQRARPERPRKRGLSVEQIVGAAVELADGDCLQAASMSRVAERLGFTPMALYRHVDNKDELIALMVEAGLGEPDPAPPTGGWRPQLERWSWDLLAALRRHPWLLSVPLPAMPFGPRRLAWLERGLAALADTELPEDEKPAVILLLNGYVFSEARLAAEIPGPAPEGDGPPNPLSALADRERFPAVRRALDAGAFDWTKRDPDRDFSFGLERVLDGIERLLEEAAGG